MKTYSAKASEIEKKWIVIDATGLVVGRLASIIAIFSGSQLFALGILGEYLARMHFRMMDRPSYAVRATTDARG